MNIDFLHEMVKQQWRANRPDDQFTLGTLIDRLAALPAQDAEVSFDFGYCYPTTFASWRGSYDQLALGYTEHAEPRTLLTPPTVRELLQRAHAADGAIFTGWKGGNFRMDRETSLWVANEGDAPYTVICGLIIQGDYGVILETRWAEPEW